MKRLRNSGLCWLLIAVVVGVVYYRLRPVQAVLPLPTHLTSARIIRADISISFVYKDGNWLLDGQVSPRFAMWLAQLKMACPEHYARAEIVSGLDDVPIILQFNDHDDWVFSAHNPYNHRHYLHHGDSVWLCNESFKPRLTQPKSYWLP